MNVLTLNKALIIRVLACGFLLYVVFTVYYSWQTGPLGMKSKLNQLKSFTIYDPEFSTTTVVEDPKVVEKLKPYLQDFKMKFGIIITGEIRFWITLDFGEEKRVYRVGNDETLFNDVSRTQIQNGYAPEHSGIVAYLTRIVSKQ